MSGCDCCVVNGELVEDKHIFERLGKTYGKIDIIEMFENFHLLSRVLPG